MLFSTIVADHCMASTALELARLERSPPDLVALGRHAEAAERALDVLARALERSKHEAVRVVHQTYAAGLVLAKSLACFIAPDDAIRARMVRFQATAARLLDTLEPYVSPGDLAMRRRLLPDPLPRASRAVARA